MTEQKKNTTSDINTRRKPFVQFEKNTAGITLVALVITIIVIVILTAIILNATIGENGVITEALKASFMAEMTALRERIDMERAAYQLDDNLENFREIFTTPITQEVADNFDETLIYEILYYRNKYGALDISSEMNITEVDIKYTYKYFENNADEFITELYYVEGELAGGKNELYIYDAKTNMAYKIPNTRIGKNTVHSLEYLLFLMNQTTTDIVLPDMVEIEGVFAEVDGISYYSPNYKGFTLENSYVVYFQEGNTGDIDNTILVPIDEYITEGSQREITKGGSTYISYNYNKQIWANVVTKNTGKEAWWVWVPRYKYTIDGTNKTIDITFVETTDTAAHPAFTVDGNELQGIWVSKYEPSAVMLAENNMLPYYLPDLTGFNEETTYIEIFDEETQNFSKEVRIADINTTLREFCNENLWFNYDKQIWANLKTVNNGLESWWVWIPRYAYSIVGNETEIRFVDIYNNSVDGSDLSNYKVHPAFTITNEDGSKTELKGIWVSKYEPSTTETTLIEQTVNLPNMVGYNVDTTYLEIYDTEGKEIKEEILLKDVIASSSEIETITENGVTVNILKSGGIDESKLKDKLGSNNVWYNYNTQIWANVKTVNNGETAYWTWIPRYSYRFWGQEMNIIFTDKNNNPTTSGLELTADYIPHSGFTVDGNELDGIWVSKYEPTGTASEYEYIEE